MQEMLCLYSLDESLTMVAKRVLALCQAKLVIESALNYLRKGGNMHSLDVKQYFVDIYSSWEEDQPFSSKSIFVEKN